MSVNILIADEHTFIRRGILFMINAISATSVGMDDNDIVCNVIGNTGSPAALASLLAQNRVDILFLGFSLSALRTQSPLSELDGIALIKWLGCRFPQTRIVVHSPYPNPNIVRMALEAGARGYISRDTCEHLLWRAISAVLNGEVYIERSLMDSLFRRNTPAGQELTSRENEVLRMLCQGLSLTAISAKMNLSNKTVSAHKIHAMEKLGV